MVSGKACFSLFAHTSAYEVIDLPGNQEIVLMVGVVEGDESLVAEHSMGPLGLFQPPSL